MLEFLDRIVAKFSPDLGIDFGCSELGVVECGKNSWREPSRLTYDIRHDKVTAVGAKSKLMEGRTSRNECVVRPIQRGCVCDYTGTLELLRFVLGRASQMGIWGPRVMLAVPVDVSEVEERVLADLCRFAGARDIFGSWSECDWQQGLHGFEYGSGDHSGSGALHGWNSGCCLYTVRRFRSR